jgi:hypothetical protein
VAATLSALVDQVASCARSRHVEETEWDLGVLTVRPAAWEGLVSRSGGYAAYADFVAQGGGEGWPWMSAPPAPVVIQMSGAMLTVPGAYTRTAFESSVVTTLAGAPERLDAAGVEGPLTPCAGRLHRAVASELRHTVRWGVDGLLSGPLTFVPATV